MFQKQYFFTATLMFISWWMAREALAACPYSCHCQRDGRSRRVIRCEEGGWTDIPVEEMNQRAQIIIISSPGENSPNNLTIGPIFTQPRPFAKLEELRIVNSNVPTIGQHSFWGLAHLEVLNLSDNNITTIVDNNFRGLVELKELYLDGNKIDIMPSETFRHLTELRILSLTNNRIKTLVPRLFRMLGRLSVLNLSGNILTEINPDIFKDIQEIKEFHCRNCSLLRINTQIYYILTKLRVIDFGENQLKYITADEFRALTKLEILKLDHNMIPLVSDNTFAMQGSMRELYLNRNRIAMITVNAFINLTHLQHLDLSYNKFDKLVIDAFAPLNPSLHYIDFSGNVRLSMSDISAALQFLPNIRGIGLANMSLDDRSLPTDFFRANPQLVSLNIAENKLTKFPVRMLNSAKYIQKLDISKNRLQTLNEEALARLEAIADIDIDKNRWNCEFCDIKDMLLFMRITVLNGTIQKLRCHTPGHLKNVEFAEIDERKLVYCSDVSPNYAGGFLAEEARLSIIAGLVLVFFILISALTVGICYSKRRTAEYYTNEEKRRSQAERMLSSEDSNRYKSELIGSRSCGECAVRGHAYGTVATIHAPNRSVSRVS